MVLPSRMNKLEQQLRKEKVLRDGADPDTVSRDDLINRRLQHLEHVIEVQVAHICGLREAVQRNAGGYWVETIECLSSLQQCCGHGSTDTFVCHVSVLGRVACFV